MASQENRRRPALDPVVIFVEFLIIAGMSRNSKKNGWISTVAQMKALASPVRHQIHLAMEMLGACSIRELASRMGREPATLYYHVNMLERAGIVIRSGVRGVGRQEEAIYELAEKQVRVDMTQRSPQFKNAMARGCGALLRYAERTFIAALKNEATIKTGKATELRIAQVNVRLTKKTLLEINRRLDEVQAYIDEADSSNAKTMYAITICVAPVASGE